MNYPSDAIRVTKTFMNVSYGFMESGQTWASVTVADNDANVTRAAQGNNFVGTHVNKIKLVNADGTPNTDLGKQIADIGRAIFGKPVTLICTMETTKSGMVFKCLGIETPQLQEQVKPRVSA